MRNPIGIALLFLLLATASAGASDTAHESAHETENTVAQPAEIAAETAKKEAPAAPIVDPEDVNVIHPVFPLLDAAGENVRASGRPMDTGKTCGNCHDTAFIQAHDDHAEVPEATCVRCHFENGRLEPMETDFDDKGNLLRSALGLHAPKPENCAQCHGLVHGGQKPLTIPDDYESAVLENGRPRYDRTLFTGEILSDRKRAESYLNLAAKDALTYPWDVHAGRMVTCTACHYSSNNPEKTEIKDDSLPFLRRDPRRLSMAEYLYRPDHRLKAAACTDCHDPMAAHEELPYRERHMAKLDCLSCHAPQMMGPALQSLDETVVTTDGAPLLDYRGMEREDGQNLNAAYITGYRPALFADGGPKEKPFAPYNLVTRYAWTDEKGAPVPFATVEKAFLGESGYHADILKLFDKNADGKLSRAELRLDDETKIAGVRKRLESLGIEHPVISGTVEPHRIRHGALAGEWVSMDCAACHGENSRIGENVVLSSYRIPGVRPRIEPGVGGPLLMGPIVPEGASWRYEAARGAGERYVLGHDRAPWSDSLGFALFILTAIGIGAHGGLRIRSRKKHAAHHAEMKRVRMYSLYERVWHWLMALSTLLLLLTGIEIHWVEGPAFFGFATAVNLHNVLAGILIANAFLSLFYHLVSTDIKQFIPRRETFLQDTIAQAKYYINGIFAGAPHPMRKTPERKLNPLQQVTYMMLLNVLLPFQVLTGAAIWAAGWWPGSLESVGGLVWMTPLHNLGAWLLASFVVTHVYLTTTGHTVFANIEAMITGNEDIEAEAASPNENSEVRK